MELIRKARKLLTLPRTKKNRLVLLFTSSIFIIYFLFNTPMALENEILDRPNVDFEGFDNVTGADHWIVPNIMHYIYFNKTKMNLIDYIVIRAAMRNHRPDKFYIHSNIPNFNLTGKYWGWVCKDKELRSRIEFHYLEAPTEIFGQELSTGWRYHHGSDIGRIRLLMKYGGIYLDNDVYVIRNLDKYRNYEFVINWDDNQFMGTQLLLAHKDARFLREWLETYKGNYNRHKWYYNAGELPTIKILSNHSELIHRVKEDFGARITVSLHLYRNRPEFDWRKLDAIHLLVNHRPYLDKLYNKTGEFNETNILKYEYPFGEMAREVLDKRLLEENLKSEQTTNGNQTFLQKSR